MKKPTINVIICTKDRPNDLKTCLESLSHSTYKQFDIFVIDQSRKREVIQANQKIISDQTKNSVRYASVTGGLSVARNFGITHTRGAIISFIDDDCIVHPKWLYTIASRFVSHTKVSGLFGNVLPYKPKEHIDLIAMSLTNIFRPKIYDTPSSYPRFIFTGNNMSFRRSIFTHIGLFNTWLGAGSIGQAAEDEDFAYRCLLHNKTILVDPTVQVFHNKWLTKKQSDSLITKYIRGYFACFTYHALCKHSKAYEYIYFEFKMLVWDIFRDRSHTTLSLFTRLQRIYQAILGILLGFSKKITDKI